MPVLTQVVVAANAVITSAAACDGFDGNAWPPSGPRRSGPEFDDFAGRFMSQDERKGHRPFSATIPVVIHQQIRPAHPRLADAHQRLAWSRRRRHDLKKFEITDAGSG